MLKSVDRTSNHYFYFVLLFFVHAMQFNIIQAGVFNSLPFCCCCCLSFVSYICSWWTTFAQPAALCYNIGDRYITLRRQRGIVCGPIFDGYESRTIPNDSKDEYENRRNQQVYSTSPVKTVDKHNDSGEYRTSSLFCHVDIIK